MPRFNLYREKLHLCHSKTLEHPEKDQLTQTGMRQLFPLATTKPCLGKGKMN